MTGKTNSWIRTGRHRSRIVRFDRVDVCRRRRLSVELLESRRVLAATVPLLESFEVANLAALSDWTFATTGSGTVAIDSTSAAHDGSSTLRFDVATDFVTSTSEAVVQLDMTSVVGATDLAFDFWMKRLNTTSATNFFLQVDASGDGTTWFNLSPKLQPTGNIWVNYVYDLDQRLADGGITLDNSVFLRLKQSASHGIHDALIDKVQVRRADVVGPKVVGVSPGSPVSPLSGLNVTFSEPIDGSTFTLADVSLVGPDGKSLPLTGSVIDIGDQMTFTVSLANASFLLGQYRAVIGPNITDLAGNLMNQDQDESNGESGSGDQFIGVFHLEMPIPQSVPYTQGFEVGSLTELAGWSFAVDSGGTITLSTNSPASGAKHLNFGQPSGGLNRQDAILALDLNAQATSSDLVLDFFAQRTTSATNQLIVFGSGDGATWTQLGSPFLGPSNQYINHFLDLDQALEGAGIVRDGDVYLRFRHEGDVLGRTMYLDDVRIANRDASGPRVVSSLPVGTVTGPVTQLQVTFSEPIDPTSFTAADLTIRDPSGIPVLASQFIDTGDSMTFRITVPGQVLSGVYRIEIGPDVRDLAGNTMNQDQDQANGEYPEDAYAYSFEIGPVVAQLVPYHQSFEVDSLNELAGWSFATTASGQVTLTELRSPHTGQKHLLLNQTDSRSGIRQATLLMNLLDQATATNLQLDFWVQRLDSTSALNSMTVQASGDGVTFVELGSAIQTDLNNYVHYTIDLDAQLSAASIARDEAVYLRFRQVGDFTSYAFTLDDVRVSTVEVDGPAISNMSPAGATVAPLNRIDLTFDEPIDTTTFTLDDIQLTGPLGAIALNGGPVDSGDQRTFALHLASDQILGGNYRVTIGPNVFDLAGNAMNQDGDHINGEVADAFIGNVSITATTASIPYAQTFDSAQELGNQWRLDRGNVGRIQFVTDGNRRVMRFDNPNGGDTSQAIVSLNLLGKTGVRLFLDEQSLFDSENTVDGIFISNNQGATWTRVVGGAPANSAWQLRQIDLDAATAAAGLTYNTDFWVKIQNSSSSGWPSNGRQYDNFIVENVGPINIALDVTNTIEGTATLPMLRISRGAGANPAVDVSLSLSSSDPSEATVQASATIPANVDFIDVPISIQEDAEVDGPQLVKIMATATGGAPRSTLLTVDDNEPATLLVSADRTVVNEATGPGAAMLTLTRNRNIGTDLLVSLSSSDKSVFTVPATALIPAGQTSVIVPITTHNDYFLDGDQMATASATATGYIDGAIAITVQNDDELLNRTIGGQFAGVLPAGTYTATFDLMVAAGQTWSILPATTVQFDSGVRLAVQGTLLAQGTEGSPISLTTSRSGDARPGDWKGVVIQGTATPTSILEHVEIAYAEIGLLMEESDPRLTLRQSLLHSHQTAAIAVRLGPSEFAGQQVQIEHNIIHGNFGYGIFLSALGRSNSGSSSVSPLIRGNVIRDNVNSGVYINTQYVPITDGTIQFGSASPLITGNHINRNRVGIEAVPSPPSSVFGSTSVSAQIYNNVIESNLGHAISLSGGNRAFNNNQVFNNSLVNNVGAGLSHSAASSSGMQVRNNVIVGNGQGIRASSGFVPSAQQVAFNNVFNSINGNWTNYPSSFGVASTTNANGTPSDAEFNLSVDPLFVLGTLFEVEPSSLINDAGTGSGQPYDDYLGRLRDAPYDLGAYEHDFVTNIVTTLLDEDDGGLGRGTGNSLREIIKATNARLVPDTIAFDPGLLGGTILLNGTPLPTLTDTTTIQGPGASLMTISGNGLSRVFDIAASTKVEISGLTIRGANGSGIVNQGTLSIRDSVLAQNVASSGGAIFSLGNLLIERSTLSQNSTTSDSGGGVYVRGSAMIVDSTIDSNHASNQGGAIYNDGSLTIINSTISGNTSNFHGGAIAQGSVDRTASLVNATVFGNRADANVDASGDGGGIYLGRVTLQNSIVAANRRGNTSADLVAVTLLAPSVHNVIGDASTAAGLVNGVNGNRVGVDPRLGSLANNGGPTRTHALLLGSPAIDGGDSSLAVGLNASVLMHDQRGPGYPRMVDGNGTGSAKVDVGAFESPLQIPLVDSILINGGASQRSSLTTVQIRFNTVVDIDQVASDPFRLVDVASGTSVADTPVISIVNGRTYVDFTFASGAHVNAGGSLIDGRYKLTIDGSKVSAFGLNLDGDANGLVGGDHVFGAEAADRFFRKYGDQNGNGTVDLLDFAEFRRTFGLSTGQSGYLGSLEANFNGSIDLVDFAAFRSNFGT